MSLKRTPELHSFLSTCIADSEMDADLQATQAYVSTASSDRVKVLATQAKTVLDAAEFPLEELGSEANRWFGDADEGRAWLRQILGVLEGAESSAASGSLVVKDSNGTPLAEGDTVQVIKDLKVKGGSSDLKRGTMIKKIHLVDDPEVIECRVNGSTLVLKTCFLKKA